jgi:glycosyltransferase involved in cell wall biosynthesis
MAGTPRVSVIIPFLNPGAFLGDAIESVFAQTLADWELWLVDDGSTDGSTDVACAAVRRDPGRVRYADHPGHENRGLPASRNLGIARARGDLIAFLDADDVWLPPKLERQVTALDSHPDAGMACESSQYWFSWSRQADATPADFVVSIPDELGLAHGGVVRPPRMLVTAYPLGTVTAPCPSSLLLRTTLVRQVEGFEASFRGIYQLYEDQTLLVKVYLRAPVYVGTGWHHRYRRHAASIESTVIAEGHYPRVRRHFLTWLAAYMRKEGVADEAIWAAWQDAMSRTPTPAPDRSA